jgi:histone-lysine N-methyltransferase SETMAR
LKSGNACSLSAQNHLPSSLLDNAPDHASLLIRSYLAKHRVSVVPHPPYSPKLAPADFFLSPKLKTTLKGRRFLTVEEIKENAIRELCAITESAF